MIVFKITTDITKAYDLESQLVTKGIDIGVQSEEDYLLWYVSKKRHVKQVRRTLQDKGIVFSETYE